MREREPDTVPCFDEAKLDLLMLRRSQEYCREGEVSVKKAACTWNSENGGVGGLSAEIDDEQVSTKSKSTLVRRRFSPLSVQ